MTNRVQQQRSTAAGTRPTAGARAPGELYTNQADLQLGVINSSKNPIDLLAVRIFSTGAPYAVGDYVVQGGQLYRANQAISAGAFNGSQWDTVTAGGGTIYVSDTAPAGAAVNSLWWNSADGSLNIRYNDGNTTQWVGTNPTIATGLDASLFQGFIRGLGLTWLGNASYQVGSGSCAEQIVGGYLPSYLMKLTSINFSKTTAAWAVGNGNGSLDTGSIAATTWYHVWLIMRPDTGIVDVLLSLQASSPIMPANYTVKRRIGSMKTDAFNSLLRFTQVGNEIIWNQPIADVNIASLTGTAVTQTLTGVPPGVRTLAKVRLCGTSSASGGSGLLLTSLEEADNAVGTPTGNYHFWIPAVSSFGAQDMECWVSTSQQVRIRGGTNAWPVTGVTRGYVDPRGDL